MSSSLHGGAAAVARERGKAAARSATLTNLFERLTAADARVRRRGSLDIDDTSDEGNGSENTNNSNNGGGGGGDAQAAGSSLRTRSDRTQPRRGNAASSNLFNAASPSLSSSRPQNNNNGHVLLRNGRAVVLSAGSRRLPPPFQEQTRVLSSVEAITTEVQGTLRLLHRDLAVHSRGRNNNSKHNTTSNNNSRSSSGYQLRNAHCGSNGGESPTSASNDGGDGLFGAASATTAAAQRRVAAEEAKVERLRIQRARAAAADEGASDDQSVEDYSVDCEIPPLTGESRLEDEVNSIAAHFAKAKASALAMAEVEEMAPSTSAAPWWSSALRLRNMKAAAARLDYHARAALGWSYRAREQLLLQVAHLNNVSATTRTQLLQQQHHWQEFQTRLKDGQQAVSQMQSSIAQWQAQAQEEAHHRTELQEELIKHARETAVVDAAESNPLKAELALLLSEREWPSWSLQRDAQTVLEWLNSTSTPLE